MLHIYIYSLANNQNLLYFQFAILLSLVLVLELAAAIAAYALQDGIKNLLAEKINITMHQYGKNEEATEAIDFLQSKVINFIKFYELKYIHIYIYT